MEMQLDRMRRQRQSSHTILRLTSHLSPLVALTPDPPPTETLKFDITMQPVCSTIPNSYSNSQVCVYGGGCRHFSLPHKAFTIKYIMANDAISRLSNKLHPQGLPFKTQAATYFVQRDEQLNSLRLADQFVEETRSLPRPFYLRNTVIATNLPNDPASASDSLKPDLYSEYLSKTDTEDVFAGINESLSALVCNTDIAITNTLKTITSSVDLASKGVNDAIDISFNNLKLSFSTTLSGLSNNSKGVSSKAAVIAVDGLRHAIISVEELLTLWTTFVVYVYASAKDMLPPELHNVLNSSEERVFNVLRPFGAAFQQVYTVLEGFETSLGINPSDPVVPFVLFLGTSTILWISYWILTYAGYAGDLSPKLTLELLNGKESVALIDDFRERDGIPDLRRTARFRYASVAFPEVDANVKKLLKGGKDLDDALIAAVIRSLKVVREGSKVIVMDVDGSRSKGIARSLRKVEGRTSVQTKSYIQAWSITLRPYLLQGGFRSWVLEGLRIKEPKPETTLTILNEEAEAILEGTTPLQVIGYGVGFLAATYSLLEWEKTLQLIAVIGLGQLGGEAIAWAAGKLETNRNGLPTSPSSVNIQNRVLQAAAKHESQPPESEEPQDTLSRSTTQNPDLSEA
ncbi:Rhodanese-like domain-containing protein [Cynara cardunculus var. scolymus]|uniref:Rhodanese-like domain-containing protein n=1 Tax=Cynara cardunculus var. scolymus TaxID=59895 RepID=A0A103XHY5_CYNCS|nr:Rhodanese-like domain-containing protein [Cynara cardunculus var. scolymus]